MKLMKLIFPNYKSKKELKEEIEKLRTDKCLASYYERAIKPIEVRKIEYNIQPLQYRITVDEKVPLEDVRHELARMFVDCIENLIEVEEYKRDSATRSITYRGFLLVGKRM